MNGKTCGDAAITFCAEAGQLELNVMMSYVAYALLKSLEIMNNAVQTFGQICVPGLKANEVRGREYAERLVGMATLLNERLGFAGAAEIAQRAAATGKSISELLEQESSIGGEHTEASKEDQP